MTAKADIILIAGQPFNSDFLFWTWKTGAPSLPVDLTGYTARAQIRIDFSATDKLADWTTENGKIVLGGVDGTIAPNVSFTETAALVNLPQIGGTIWQGRQARQIGVWDLELISPTNQPRRLLQGKAYVVPEATRE